MTRWVPIILGLLSTMVRAATPVVPTPAAPAAVAEFELWIEAPPVVYVGTTATIKAKTNDALGVLLELQGTSVCSGTEECAYPWTPSRPGTYIFQAVARFSGQVVKFYTKEVPVKPAPNVRITPINRYALLATIDKLDPKTPVSTGIDAKLFACGMAGFQALGSDISEDDIFVNSSIVYFRLSERGSENDRTWYVETEFATLDSDFFEGSDPEETWRNVSLLCVDRQVASIHTFKDLGDDVHKPTGIRFDQYACGIASFDARDGDINESDVRNPIETHLYRQDGYWAIRSDFATESNHGDPGESWDVSLLCLKREVAALDGPVPNLPFFTQEFRGPYGNNLGQGLTDYDTKIPSADYACAVVGFAAKDGKIDYNGKKANASLLQAYLKAAGGTWHFRGDFRSHDNHEHWDNLNVLCGLRDGGRPPGWNRSRLDVGPESCGQGGMACQVLRDEWLNLWGGNVVLTGGGYQGSPSRVDSRCPSDQDIEVYVNHRDLGTGKPRWSGEPTCLSSGDSLTMKSGPEWTYDFRGASVQGGATPLPIELHAPEEPDLVVQALGWPPRAMPGSLANFTYQVRNQGTAATRVAYVNQLYVDGARLSDRDGQTGSRPGTGLTPGASDTNGFEWRATCGNTNTIETHTIKVWTDDTDQLTERDERNNIVEGRIEVRCRRPVFEPLTDVMVPPNGSVTVRVVARDPDGDRLVVAMADAPPGAWVDEVTPGVGNSPASLLFHWWPDQVGLHFVTFIATDEGGLSATATLSILVCDQPGVFDCPL